MKSLILSFLLILIGLPAFSQADEKWTAFWDDSTQLMGFKNSVGEVMIEPKFMGFTIARAFENVIAVMEENNGQYEAYYLAKSGKKFGIDSLHIYDNGADCESEGFIRFRDKKTDMVGMFDKNGNRGIPAIYNEVSRMQNGLIHALKGAKKEYWDSHGEAGCTHFSWKGGQHLLLNAKNQTLIADFKYEGPLDLFNMQVQDEPSTEATKVSFKGVNGKYYVFTDIEKGFKHWLATALIPNLTLRKLEASSMDSLTFWQDPEGWITESKRTFLSRNIELINARLQSIQLENSDHFVSIGGLNPYMYQGDHFAKYYNTCGEAKETQYPVLNLIINHKTNADLEQDHIEFLKTDAGYRLISVSINAGK